MAIHPRNDGGPFEYVVDAQSDLANILHPKIGQFALVTGDGTLHYHTGTAWSQISGGTGDTVTLSFGGNVVG